MTNPVTAEKQAVRGDIMLRLDGKPMLTFQRALDKLSLFELHAVKDFAEEIRRVAWNTGYERCMSDMGRDPKG